MNTDKAIEVMRDDGTMDLKLSRVYPCLSVVIRVHPCSCLSEKGPMRPLSQLRAAREDQSVSASRAFWKRLACERSALASVSNQSAISSKPSPRADLAMPGYMSVYSWVSPATAAFRFWRELMIGCSVAWLPTC